MTIQGIFKIFRNLIICVGLLINEAAVVMANPLKADLAFIFTCQSKDDKLLEAEILKFLQRLKFKTLDKVLLAQKRGEASPFSTDIIGISHNDSVITFSKLSLGNDSFHTIFRSKPPTVHQEWLETEILQFVEFTLMCIPKQIERHKNTEENLKIFNEVMQIYQSWFAMSGDILQ